MASASSSVKQPLIRSTFHSMEALFMRSQTRVTFGQASALVTTLYEVGLGIHLSHHTLTHSLEPICHLVPLRTTPWAAIILRQA